ncbi:MAG: mechanosensitive ion channel [Deltaproteobacteria bacterium]|nr:mechanosensitive ion channel [Deltaproteobacteria bacterium]
MEFLRQIEAAAGPLIPGVITAAICIVFGVGVQLRFRGQTFAMRFRRPMVILNVYLFVAALAVATRMYWPVAFKAAYFISVLVLSLALVLATVTALMDGFLGRYRSLTVPSILRDMLIVVVYAVVILVVLHQEGVEVTSLLTTSAVFTAIIGFALQDLLSNVISGLSIQMERPFKEGDWVRFDNYEGKVTEINWRATKIETRGRDVIIIPNNMATRSPLVNYSAPTSLHRRTVSVGLRYEVPPNQVHACLTAAALSVKGVRKDPAPRVLTKKYSDFSIDYDMVFFIDDLPHREVIESEVMSRIWYHLNREGLSIPFPIRDVNVRTISSETEAMARSQHVRNLTAAISRIPEFSPLPKADLTYLAEHARSLQFAAGETIIREGSPGVSCYIVERGEVIVESVGDATQPVVELARLGVDDYFGERSLITGEPTSASVRTATDCEIYEISKADLATVLKRNQALVDALGQRLAEREAEQTAARERTSGSGNASDRPTEPAGFVRRIRSFFQL